MSGKGIDTTFLVSSYLLPRPKRTERTPCHAFVGSARRFIPPPARNKFKDIAPPAPWRTWGILMAAGGDSYSNSLAEELGLPLIPGTGRGIKSWTRLCEELVRQNLAERVEEDQIRLKNCDLWFKAPGRTSKRISSIEEAKEAFTSLPRSERKKATFELYVPNAYLVRIQFFVGRDETPNQPRELHFIEERRQEKRVKPSILLDDENPPFALSKEQSLQKLLEGKALEIIAKNDFDGPGTITFLIDPEGEQFYFSKIRHGHRYKIGQKEK